jgi:hypothetical protein
MAGSTWQGRAVHFMVHRKERGERRKRERERERTLVTVIRIPIPT